MFKRTAYVVFADPGLSVGMGKGTVTLSVPYRLKVKELRYVLQMAGDAERNELVARLGEVKDAIGEWHDWETLAGIAAEQLTHGARCPLVHQIRSTVSREYDRALALTLAAPVRAAARSCRSRRRPWISARGAAAG